MNTDTGSLIGAISSGRDIGKYEKCSVCKKYAFMGTHKCGLSFLCGIYSYKEGEKMDTVYAHDSKTAAEDFLANNFSGLGYPDIITVYVIDEISQKEYEFEVTVEAVPEFSAEQISCKDIVEQRT